MPLVKGVVPHPKPQRQPTPLACPHRVLLRVALVQTPHAHHADPYDTAHPKIPTSRLKAAVRRSATRTRFGHHSLFNLRYHVTDSYGPLLPPRRDSQSQTRPSPVSRHQLSRTNEEINRGRTSPEIRIIRTYTSVTLYHPPLTSWIRSFLKVQGPPHTPLPPSQRVSWTF